MKLRSRVLKFMGIPKPVSLALILAISFAVLAAGPICAQPIYPEKAIAMIITFTPGGGRDTLGRGVSRTLEKYLGVPVVIKNKPGAGGVTGLVRFYKSRPDGYTIALSCGPDVLTEMIRDVGYDTSKFIYMGRIQSSPSFTFVKADSQFRSVSDFKEYGKTIRYAVFRLTSGATVTNMVLAQEMGYPFDIVPGYKSVAETMVGLVRGDVEVAGSLLSAALPFVKSGDLRCILVNGYERNALFPGVPTVGEIGFPDLGFVGTLDYWLVAPPGTPKDKIEILESALEKTIKDPEFVAWAEKAGIDVAFLPAEDTRKIALGLRKGLSKYKPVILRYLR
ncbi:Bug family tripartite tricarboxylate transporter substrate binding protein [Thermodesulfobacteriota bacterium]